MPHPRVSDQCLKRGLQSERHSFMAEAKLTATARDLQAAETRLHNAAASAIIPDQYQHSSLQQQLSTLKYIVQSMVRELDPAIKIDIPDVKFEVESESQSGSGSGSRANCHDHNGSGKDFQIPLGNLRIANLAKVPVSISMTNAISTSTTVYVSSFSQSSVARQTLTLLCLR
jgi:hypothetical protein